MYRRNAANAGPRRRIYTRGIGWERAAYVCVHVHAGQSSPALARGSSDDPSATPFACCGACAETLRWYAGHGAPLNPAVRAQPRKRGEQRPPPPRFVAVPLRAFDTYTGDAPKTPKEGTAIK